MGVLGEFSRKVYGTRLHRPVNWLQRTISSPDVRPHLRIAAKLGICMKPEFIIIGTQKGGTTSLYAYLGDHPNVRRALRKEVHFFDRYYRRGWNWYQSHFPIAKADEPNVITGEASPSYMLHPGVPGRIAQALPNVKLIALLRNPIDRAYSQFQHNRKVGDRTLTSFEQALERERTVLAARGGSLGLYDSMEFIRNSFLARGVYVDQLRRWLEIFPREQLLVLKSEEFYQEPAKHFAAVLDFIGLPQWTPAEFETHNRGRYSEKKIRPETLAELREYYRPYNQQLGELLGMDFSSWDD